MCVTCADTVALKPLTNRISTCWISEDQVKFFVFQCSNQDVFVSHAGLMFRLTSTYVSMLFIIKSELPLRVRSVECVKITFFNFFDNDPIELIFGDKLRGYAYCKLVLVSLRKLSAVFRHSVFGSIFHVCAKKRVSCT
jgi:hypothetical protein